MESYQKEFIQFSIDCGVLRFGEFTLKSGRKSPYFFNTGLFNSGMKLSRLGEFYSSAIVANEIEFDGVFGPAYKGIPLGTAIVIALAQHHGKDVPASFNRKEVKDHGEGGTILGAPLTGRQLIVDDVISAGTSVNESVTIIKAHQAIPSAVMISLDRQERGKSDISAIAEVEKQHDLRVHSIVTLFNIIEFLERKTGFAKQISAIREYRHEFGA
ncbi:MAG: orotate phosphoribosyltransferase [Gammaproteobacteria bacterium]